MLMSRHNCHVVTLLVTWFYVGQSQVFFWGGEELGGEAVEGLGWDGTEV